LKKITQWKRRQINKGELMEWAAPIFDYVNPASISTPTGKLLPLHLLVRRRQHNNPTTTTPTPTTLLSLQKQQPSLLPANHADLIRVLVHAHPPALVTRDVHGRTPLMTAMLQTDRLPSEEILELLLGLRTPQSSNSQSHQVVSPAKIPTEDTLQLPLHVAAEEMAHNFGLLSTIYEAYPDARKCPDIRGRTPLHLALGNYRSTVIDESLLELLFNESVCQMQDDDGKKPIDLVFSNPACLKEGDSIIFQRFLDASIDKNRYASHSDNNAALLLLLRQLRSLPPWLRRHACAAQFVQHALLEQVASPWNTFWILLNGGVWIALLVLLRLLLENGREELELELVLAVYVLSSYQLAAQVVSWMTAISLGETYRLCLTNPWRWIQLFSLSLSIATAYFVSNDVEALRSAMLGTTLANFVPDEDDALVASLGASATAALWLSLVGFLVQWWCGMAVFCGASLQLFTTLVWPLVLAAMGIVSMSQVLYTTLQDDDCTQQNNNICSLSDAYTMVYWMILGEPVVSDEEWPTSLMVLLIVFTFLWVWWIVSVIVMVVSEPMDRAQLALTWYWEPKVALLATSAAVVTTQLTPTPSCSQRYCDSMEGFWHILTSSLATVVGTSTVSKKKQERLWYACCFRPGVIYLTRLMAVLILPLWFLLGVATLGVFWPPQVRRWLFQTTTTRSSIGSNHRQQSSPSPVEERLSAAKLSHLQSELYQFQATSQLQSQQLQADISQIKDILVRAMTEEE
jgi:ankyrin repeat protein